VKNKPVWKASDTSAARYLGTLEIETPKGFEAFEILALPDRLLFGGACNVGFLESGYILTADYANETEALADLHDDLETYYRDGAQYVSAIVHNERM
jgi:hypothetical protein